MAFIPIQLLQFNITSLLTPLATSMGVGASIATQINTALGTGNYTICSISNGAVSELIHITGASGNTATIVRAQEGTVAQTFAAGTQVRFVWTAVGIQEIASGGSSGITITDSGIITVTGGPLNFGVGAPPTTITAGAGISIGGSWPAFTVTNTFSGSTPATVVTGSGTANVTPITGGYNVGVAAGTLLAGTGISITGSWPNYTITNSAPASGGTGTVTSVTAGTGIAVTGSPTVTPIIGLVPTGITAGVYGGLTINAAGQIIAASSSLITGIASANPSLTVSAPTAGVVTLTAVDATNAQKGVVRLASSTSGGSNNPADALTAVTPAGIAAVFAAQAGTVLGANGSLIPLLSTLYTTVVGVSSVSLNLAAGHSAIVNAYVEVMDPVNPTAIPSFGLGLFNSTTFIDGNSPIPSATRNISTFISGPFVGIVSINITALTGTQAVQSWYCNVVAN